MQVNTNKTSGPIWKRTKCFTVFEYLQPIFKTPCNH